jgi:hypothetical protein
VTANSCAQSRALRPATMPGLRGRRERHIAVEGAAIGAVSSVGRAPARQAGGHWFEPSTAHGLDKPFEQHRGPVWGLFLYVLSAPCQRTSSKSCVTRPGPATRSDRRSDDGTRSRGSATPAPRSEKPAPDLSDPYSSSGCSDRRRRQAAVLRLWVGRGSGSTIRGEAVREALTSNRAQLARTLRAASLAWIAAS